MAENISCFISWLHRPGGILNSGVSFKLAFRPCFETFALGMIQCMRTMLTGCRRIINWTNVEEIIYQSYTGVEVISLAGILTKVGLPRPLKQIDYNLWHSVWVEKQWCMMKGPSASGSELHFTIIYDQNKRICLLGWEKSTFVAFAFWCSKTRD